MLMGTDLRDRLAAAVSVGGPLTSDFDLNPGLAPVSDLRPAAVLIGVVNDGDTPRVVLTRRSAALRHHAGQIAFPGGKVDPDDDGPISAALREAKEEVGLPPGAAEVLGVLPAHRTVTQFSVTPVVALLSPNLRWTAEIGEVEEVFEVPLDHLRNPDIYRVEGRNWQGVFRRYYSVPWGPYYIWGATARILRGLADRLEP